MNSGPITKFLFALCASSALLHAQMTIAASDDEKPLAYVPISIAQDHSLALRMPKEENVVFRGVVSFDKAGTGPGGMLYPTAGLGAAGLLIGVLTHGLISESSKNSQKEKIQLEADAVLAPYKDMLSTYKYKDLMVQGLEKTARPQNKRLIENTENAQSGWLVISAPIFSMTQDRRAIVLDNSVGIYAHDSMATPKYQTVIRVVSNPKDESEATDYWGSNQGEKLKQESAALFTKSLDIAMNDAEIDSGKDKPVHKTVRYMEGGQEKMERAQLINESCKRVLIKTLRGGIMSVPVQSDSAAEKCLEVPSNQK
jgi:hypothetical protein